MPDHLFTGLDVVLADRPDALRGRVGLVTHPAALSVDGRWSANAMRAHPDIDLRVLMGPEHGVFGQAGAGEPVASQRHPDWDLPMFSLYGEQRKPTEEMLEQVDVLAVDLQDLGVRCYTYVSTLYLVLQAAAEHGKRVVVLDRPIPLPYTVDGPPLDPAFASFVAQVPVPMVYGMTPGEVARLVRRRLPALDLEVVPMHGYRRTARRPVGAPPWVPPSPGIRSWNTAQCYPVTVCCEALPALDYGAGTPLPFEVVGAPWLDPSAVIEAVGACPGVRLYPHRYYPSSSKADPAPWPGIRLVVSSPPAYRPIRTCVVLLHAVQQVHGRETLWSAAGTREAFFDKLFGTDRVRRDLQAGLSPDEICSAWEDSHARYLLDERTGSLLYPADGERAT